jgi:hypothetical protein
MQNVLAFSLSNSSADQGGGKRRSVTAFSHICGDLTSRRAAVAPAIPDETSKVAPFAHPRAAGLFLLSAKLHSRRDCHRATCIGNCAIAGHSLDRPGAGGALA